MNKRQFNVAVGVVVVVAALSYSASAALQVDDTAYYGSASSPLPDGSSLQLSLDEFDTSLGTLAGVTIELFSYDTISSLVFNASMNGLAYSMAAATVPVTVTTSDADGVLNGLSTTATGTAGPFAGAAPGLALTVAGSASLPLHTASISPADFPYQAQGGGEFTFNLAVANASGLYSGYGGSYSLFFGGGGSSYGSVEVDYTYTPAVISEPVPEADTLCAGLALTGLCGIEVARRFHRISSRA